MDFFCPGCRSTVRLSGSLQPEELTLVVALVAESKVSGVKALVDEYRWAIREAKCLVIHLAGAAGECHRCGRAMGQLCNPELCEHCGRLNVYPARWKLSTGYSLLRLEGWNYGLEKVSTTEAFKETLGIRLRSAHALTEKLLALSEPLHVGPVPTDVAEELGGRLGDLGVDWTVVGPSG